MRKICVAVCLLVASTLAAADENPSPGASCADLDDDVHQVWIRYEAGRLDALLSAEDSESFAGLWIEHEPELRVIVRSTDRFAVTHLKSLVAGGPLEDLVEIRPARWSLRELRSRQAVAEHLARELAVPVHSKVDVFENRVEVQVVEAEKLRGGLARSGIKLPEGVEVQEVGRLARPTLHGGVALSMAPRVRPSAPSSAPGDRPEPPRSGAD